MAALLAKAAEVDDGICHELPRAVVCYVAASVRPVHIDVLRLELLRRDGIPLACVSETPFSTKTSARSGWSKEAQGVKKHLLGYQNVMERRPFPHGVHV